MSTHETLKAFYPSLTDKGRDEGQVTSALKHSIVEKAAASRDTNARFFAEQADELLAAAQSLAQVYRHSGRLFTMGNGGSSCDASHIAVEFVHPVTAGRPALAATSLVADLAMISAVGNDLGFDHITMPIPNLRATGMPYIEPLGLWHSLLGDLIMGTDKSVIAARFHKGLAKAIAAMAGKLAGLDEEEAVEFRFDTVALSGGCFQNRVLFEETVHRLEARNFKVLGHSVVPANDGGIALGQAAVAAACAIATQKINSREAQPCA